MSLGEEFRSDVVTVSPEDTIREAAWKMKDEQVGSVVVAHGGRQIVGILTDRDIALKLALGEAKPSTPVEEAMATHVYTIRANGSLADAAQYFKTYQIRRLPIVDENGELIGIVTLDDVLNALAEQLKVLGQAVSPMLVAKEHD
jgi:CBS domain-containing protein